MYERFTDQARRVMMLANQEADRLRHEYIGTEHILLGLIEERAGMAALLFEEFHIDPRTVRAEIERIAIPGPDISPVGGKVPQTPRAWKAIEYAIDAAHRLSHNYVGTDHLLFGLLRDRDGLAAELLQNLGMDVTLVAAAIDRILGEDFVRGPAESVPSTNYDDLPADQRDAVNRLNQEIGRLHWDKENAVAEARFEAAAAILSEIKRLEQHKQAVAQRRPIDDRITNVPPRPNGIARSRP
jgi:Clp amino terminal domain, pathogenicity island component